MSFADVVTVIVGLLLLAHALKTHGAWFAAIWLGLPALMWILGLIAMNWNAWSEITSANVADGARVACALFLAALFAKGIIERTRFAGGVVAFALTAAACAVPVALAGAIAADDPIRPIATFLPPFVLLFSIAYRSVSLFTSRNGVKFCVLLVLSPPIGLFTVVIGRMLRVAVPCLAS